ncbi:unnamed protein product, partial [Ectocarpus sp. 13 AM-2016]
MTSRGLNTAAGAAISARYMTIIMSIAVLRDVVAWRNGACLQRLRGKWSCTAVHTVSSPPVSRQIRGHRRLRALPGSLSPHRDSGCQSAKDHPTTSRRRRCRLRSGSTVHDWPLSPQRSPSSSADFVDRDEQEPVTAVASVGALRNGGSGETTTRRAGNTVGYAHQTHGGSNRCRRKRRRRRRQRLRLQTLGDMEVGAAEALSAMEATIVEAESLGLETAIRPSTGVGAAVAPSIVDSKANVANRERCQRQQQLLQVDGVVSAEEIATRDDVDTDLSRSGGEDVSCSGSGSFSEERSSTSTRTRPLATGGLEGSQLMAEQVETLLQGGHSEAVQDNYASEVPKYSEEDDDRFMRIALRLAGRARMEGEVPIGAILAETVPTRRDGRRRVLSTGRNEVEGRRDASAHAEMLCLRVAAKARSNWRLAGTTLFVTVEPCAMCLSAAQLFRVDRVVFGAPNPNLGACGGWVDLSSQRHAFHELEVKGGVLAEECALPLRGFFRSRRRGGEIASAG